MIQKLTFHRSAPLALLAALLVAVPVSAQSTGPTHAGYDPNAPVGAHSYEGEIGAKLLIIERALKCNCGCGLDVHSCQFQMQCGTSPGWTRRILEALEAGETPEAIKASFVADFGPEVLMLPPAEGFNLLGYLLPAVAIVTAGMFVGVLARGNQTRAQLAPVQELSDAEQERLEEAIRRLDAEESPDW